MSLSPASRGIHAASRISGLFPVVAISLSFISFASEGHAQTLMHSENSLLAIDDVEITPDQRYAVVRQNNFTQFSRVYDLATGALVASPSASSGDGLLGECLDAVAVTNTRAIVLGNRAQILDLTNLANPVVSSNEAGFRPRDVAITPDGVLACVRGGATAGIHVGGQYIFDLATGTQVGFHPGEPTPYGSGGPYSFNVDDVAVTNSHAVMTSFIGHGSGIPETRVTIWELHPGGGPPTVAFETGAAIGTRDQGGAPYDLAITPDGTKAVVRSELEIGLYDLTVSPPAGVWQRRPGGSPGAYLEEALDAVELTNDRILTISRITNPALGTGTQVDVVEMNGTDHHSRISGSPHDLAITPNGERAVVRTSTGMWVYDLVNLPVGPVMHTLSQARAPSISIQYFGGLDSVAVTDRFAVTLSRAANHIDTHVYFWDISGPDVVKLEMRTIPNTRPIDLAITPDQSKVVVTGNSNITVFELATGVQLFTHDACPPTAFYPWCDGVAVSNDRAVGTCQWDIQSGWVTIVDIASFATNYCVGAPNSAGAGAKVSAAGTLSVAANDLKLFVADAPQRVSALFYYGATQTQTPFNNGFQCVGGTPYFFSPFSLNEAGAGWQAVDYSTLPPGGQIAPGSTWHFQCQYRDNAAGGARLNTSDGMSILFQP